MAEGLKRRQKISSRPLLLNSVLNQAMISDEIPMKPLRCSSLYQLELTKVSYG